MNLATLLSQLPPPGIRRKPDTGRITVGSNGCELPNAVRDGLRNHKRLLELLVPRVPATPPAPPDVVRYVTRVADLEAVANDIAAQERVGFDVETTGLDPLCDKLCLVQVAIPNGNVYVLDVRTLTNLGPVVDALRGVEWVGHNLQFDLRFAAQHLQLAPRATWCTMTASKLLDGGLNLHTKGFHTLRGVTERELHLDLPKENQKSDWSKVLANDQVEYAARDAAIVLVLRDLLHEKLARNELLDVATLEFSLLPVLTQMWLKGVGFDRSRWGGLLAHRTSFAESLGTELRKDLRASSSDELDDEINPRSPPQVLNALRLLGLGATGTSKEALAPHATNPVVAKLVRFRSLMSFVRGPGRSFPEAAALHEDGRIRTHLDPLAAPTGRFGCSKPNLQGLEKSKKKREGDADIPEPRSCIVPSSGSVFVDADYAAIELRVLASITGDQHLKRIFNTGGDPHLAMAALVSGKPEDKVAKAERDRAKPVNFGFPFGMGVDRFIEYALALYGVAFTKPEATRFKDAWKRSFPGVVGWQKKIGNSKPMTIRSQSGRRRAFESRFTGYCERLNMPVQGTAADGMKRSMVLLHERLQAYDARIVLCVHDELLVEVTREQAVAVMAVVKKTMEHGMRTYVPDVPIVVEADIRTSWSAKDIIATEATP